MCCYLAHKNNFSNRSLVIFNCSSAAICISSAAWAGKEQSAVDTAPENVLHELAKANEEYEQKFSFIFIVCATGKSAEEMLAILQGRLPNNAADEIQIAADEQLKITKLRLEKLFL